MAVIPPSERALAAAGDYSRRVAPVALTPNQARLYSHVTRLRGRQPGIPGWGPPQAERLLDEAVRLLEAGSVERDANLGIWQSHVRRAAEILEWLSEPLLGLDVARPVSLLSAAAYQLAGYPAQALGLLSATAPDASDSILLRRFLRADFPALLDALLTSWGEESETAPEAAPANETDVLRIVSHRIVSESTRCFGILCAYMRWGDSERMDAAIRKLDNVASVLARSTDAYSWLLARLSAEVLRIYNDTALRRHVSGLKNEATPEGALALERYLRRAYQKGRALAWPSQIRGIDSLSTGESFALCTPTGSGKTTIAELAILQSLFSAAVPGSDGGSPLVLYLTPSRALAAEVEAKLASVVRGLSNQEVQVTGLYGGTDWGPSDAWLTTDRPTVLICTYEKAEALLRFLGLLFMRRVGLIVVDEAHQVQWSHLDPERSVSDSRPLRLESLVTRLLTFGGSERRMIALSAIAGGIEDTLARWLTGNVHAIAAREPYRSTRQLVGKLEWVQSGFRIEYDLLNNRRLSFAGTADLPFVANPFPRVPNWTDTPDQPEVALRAPALWAALHIAASGGATPQAVLIFAPEKPEQLASTFLELLENLWRDVEIPNVFSEPQEGPNVELWQRCLAACADFFGIQSHEYRLLRHGVVLHHGKMPGPMARLLVEIVERRIANIVVATSTLSDGVNLPFETVLFYSPYRNRRLLSTRDVQNTIGRAGRPGHGTEGRALFLMPRKAGWKSRRAGYEQIINSLVAEDPTSHGAPASPLAAVLRMLRSGWQQITGSNNESAFLAWLESTVPSQVITSVPKQGAIDALDSLDQLLLAVAAEVEQLGAGGADFEDRLQAIWQRSYAHYAAAEEARLGSYFVHRGKALRTRLYPDADRRRRLYVTSLPPRAGEQFLAVVPEILNRMRDAFEYATWNAERRAQYLEGIIEALALVPTFAPTKAPGGKQGSWQRTLRWWLRVPGAARPNTASQISQWYKHANESFAYRLNWGIGSVIGMVTYEASNGELTPTRLENWPATGMPWVVVWIKELISWGTLDPVAAALLAQRKATTRAEAEDLARTYYQRERETPPNEQLHPSRVRLWTDEIRNQEFVPRTVALPNDVPARLLQVFPTAGASLWRVLPVAVGADVRWYDPAGYPLAESPGRADLCSAAESHDFNLDAAAGKVLITEYLRGS